MSTDDIIPPADDFSNPLPGPRLLGTGAEAANVLLGIMVLLGVDNQELSLSAGPDVIGMSKDDIKAQLRRISTEDLIDALAEVKFGMQFSRLSRGELLQAGTRLGIWYSSTAHLKRWPEFYKMLSTLLELEGDV